MTELSVAREMQVARQMQNLEETLSELEQGMHDIKARLTPVLRDDTVIDTSEEEKEAVLVPLAGIIRTATNRVQALNAATVILLRDLEL